MKVCIIGASGKLGRYVVEHAPDRAYDVVGVCREESVAELSEFKGRITLVPARPTIAKCSGVPSLDAAECWS